MKRLLYASVILICTCPITTAEEPIHVLIVVGPSNHPPGSHEVAAGSRIMQYCLEHAGNLKNIKAEVVYNWPDKAKRDSASTVVFMGDTFPANRLPNPKQNLADLQEMMQRGCGIVCVHYATGLLGKDVEPNGEHPLLQWMGGYFANRSCPHHQSFAKIFPAAKIQPAAARHPISRGWQAFTLHDEPYTNNYFGQDGNKLVDGVTALATSMLPPNDPKRETVAWCIDRADGGRGFGIVMPHFYKNWLIPELRTFILNGIVWTAQRDVPKKGVQSELPDLALFAPQTNKYQPHPEKNPQGTLMLDIPSTGTDPARINFAKLPRVPLKHAIISDVRDRGGKWVHQHAYLVHHAKRYWAMWSDGPGVPKRKAKDHRNLVPGHDQPGTRVSYATSKDGLNWSKPADLSGPPRKEEFGWIARGFWVRDGQLLALASHFHAPGYPGKGLSLEAFRWDQAANKWVTHGRVLDDTLNNFPPKRLPNGDWMMTRRDHQRQVTVMQGGVKSFNDWNIHPLAAYDKAGRPEEPYWYLLPDGKNIVGLIRDNGKSKRLIRVYSTDKGKSWSKIVRTNFPDATSKFFVLRTSRGYYALVSNSNPRKRDPLTLALSQDGLVYRHLFYVVGGRHVDYPHIIEQDNHLLIAFSGAKQTMEVVKISLDAIDQWMETDQQKNIQSSGK